MIELYSEKYKMNIDDATLMAEILAKNKQAWVDIMMVEELGLLPSDESPIKGSLVMFFSFALFGLVPLLPFIVFAIISIGLP